MYIKSSSKHVQQPLYWPGMGIPISLHHGPNSSSLIMVREKVSIHLDAERGVDESRRRGGIAQGDATLLQEEQPYVVFDLSPAGAGRRV